MLSHLIRDYWFFIVVGILLFVYGIHRAFMEPIIRSRIDRLKLKLPVFGQLNQMVMVSRFIRTFSTLVTVGVPLIDALEVSNAVAHNDRMTEITRALQESVRAGSPVARSMASHAVFPPMVIQMADSGEQAGVLDQMLCKAADFIDKDIDRTVSNMLVKLEPMITLTMGLIVGMILIGVYLPMFDYINYLE
jgi:type IV pilus assembly protein PilC